MNNLIIIAHPDKQSFCHNGIFKTICNTLTDNKEKLDIIDLYDEKFNVFGDAEKTKLYQDLITKSNRIYIISPVWWFRFGYKGTEEPRDWIADSVTEYYPSFFVYWKKVEKQLYKSV